MFKTGDEVSFLDEPGGGEITRIEGREIYVLSDEGFETPYSAAELVLRRKLEVGEVKPKDQPGAKKQEAMHHTAPGKLEVDLHFNALVEFPKNYAPYQRLDIQLREARKALDKARRGGIKKVIIIHGVGEGRLKEEVHTLLERMDRLTFYDASFAEYGSGATEVELL